MRYRFEYLSVVFRDDIPKLDAAVYGDSKTAIEMKLRETPRIYGKPLRQSLKGYRSLRVGDYRIVYRIEREVVLIVALRHRRDVYRVASLRV